MNTRKQIVNVELIKDWLYEQGKRVPNVRVKLMYDAGISESTFLKMLAGRVPGEDTRNKVAQATGIDEKELFPFVIGDNEKEAA